MGNKIHYITISLLVLCLIGIGYVIYNQRVYYPAKIQKCFKIAVGIEQQRHRSSVAAVGVEDVSEYLKNMDSCLSY